MQSVIEPDTKLEQKEDQEFQEEGKKEIQDTQKNELIEQDERVNPVVQPKEKV